MENVFVGGFARTPIGRLDGNLKTLSAEELAVEAVHAVLSETGLSPDEISEVIIGNAKQTSTHSNLAGMLHWLRACRKNTGLYGAEAGRFRNAGCH